jgi:gamma-glutamylputrescine oxidase
MNIRMAASAAFEKTMLGAARAVSLFTYPAGFEHLGLDDNRSVWVSYTPDYQPGPPLREDMTADLAIIGGGFTGVSTAYHFSRRYPEKRVVLLEARSLANGASGRNGGMVLNWTYGVDETDYPLLRRIYDVTKAGIDAIENIIHEHRLQVSFRRDGSLQVYTTAASAEAGHAHIEALNQHGVGLQYLDRPALAQKIDLQNVYGASFDPTEGQLNGAQYIRALRPILLQQGVQIYEQTPVLKVREGSTIALTTPQAEVKARAIVLATNAYTGKLGYFRKAFFPLHSHVFATAPLTPEQQAEIGWHQAAAYADDVNRISYSSRTPEGHIIFGGGSNSSYAYLFNNRTAFAGSPDSTRRGFDAMHKTMVGYLPKSYDLPIAYRWTGTLAITLKRNCSMGVMGENRNVFFALGYSGHGVTMANLAGKILTDIYSGNDQQWRDLPFYQARFAPIPLDPFRWLGYQLFTRLTGRSPRIR